MPPPLPPPLGLSNIRRGYDSADDLIVEENDVVQEALKRLPPKIAYDRMFRMRRAVQVSFFFSSPPLPSFVRGADV